ncbi:ComEC/Rec2 family competence protein [Christensenella timonensis]|uniref:ComEC/Rec2 family competence protein n=1 Tax=Christensenella timonensis TaxID=1816678 RepID=UPI00082F6784|nr:ComEC/Rec2 family competence protein [Christensenella timonensis]
MARRKRKSTAANLVIALICLLILVLFLVFGSHGTFLSNLGDVWNNTVNYGTAEQNVAALVTLEKEQTDLLLYVIDTGNSDSMVLRTPDGHAILVDAADNDDRQRILDTLKALGIEKLDAAVATHPDADHIGSMDDVLLNIPVATFYRTSKTAKTKTYDNMVDAAEQKQIPVTYVTAGDTFSIGGLSLKVLNPQDKKYDDTNNSSIVLLVEYGETSFLLSGDAEEEAIADMLGEFAPDMDIDVLKIGHHGSHNATTEELLDATTPNLAIITCGEDNDYGHPHKETLDLLGEDNITTLRTDEKGDIAIFSDGTDITYKTAA